MDNFFKKTIENSIDNSRRFENVQEELFDYQLQYVEKLEKGEIKENSKEDNWGDEESEYMRHKKIFEDSLKNTFQKRLFKYTYLEHQLLQEYLKRKENRKFFNDWFKDFINNVNIIYLGDNKNWKEGTLRLIKDELKKIGPILDLDKKKEEVSETEKNAGLINFDLGNSSGLEEFGIKKDDTCVYIHFEDLSKQKGKNTEINNIFSGESLSKLAIKIIEECPEAKAVIGRSWLVDSPIGKRIGFNVYKKYENVVDNPSFWGQFINEKGEINKQKMEKFLETGKGDYYPAQGFINIEDFLRKYLPKERRGVIKLRDLSEDSKRFKEEKNKVIQEIDNNFADLSYEEIERISKGSVISDFFENRDGEEFLSLIKKMKEQGLKSMNDLNDERINYLKNSFNSYFIKKETEYVEREVLID